MSSRLDTETLVLISIPAVIALFGLAAIVGIIIYRPTTDAVQLGLLIGFLTQIILGLIAAIKGIQNSSDIKKSAANQQETGSDVKTIAVKVDGNIEALVAQHTAVATLTEQLAAVKLAAELAAKTASDTAIALAAKVDFTTAAVKENGIHQ
jgi:hypothetical protein